MAGSGSHGASASGRSCGDVGTRDEHALIDVETELAQPCLVRQIRRRNALVDAALDQRGELGAFRVGESGVEKRVEPIERKVQRVQNQIDRFVVRACRAVTEEHIRRH